MLYAKRDARQSSFIRIKFTGIIFVIIKFMKKENYLRRIGINNTDLPVTVETLRILQREHLLRIPFENLDIQWKRLIALDVEKFYEKLVSQKRGGFCYELNGLFNELLNEIGFHSRIISARIAKADGELGAEYDHLAILTRIGDEEFLVDVGFGSFTAEPLRFVLNVEQKDANGIFMIRKFDEEYFEVVKKDVESWSSEYIFKNLSRDLSEFTEMCNFHQTSLESHFTRGKVCSLMTLTGRKTLTDKKFIETAGGEKTERDVNSEAEFDQILAREFIIVRDF